MSKHTKSNLSSLMVKASTSNVEDVSSNLTTDTGSTEIKVKNRIFAGLNFPYIYINIFGDVTAMLLCYYY